MFLYDMKMTKKISGNFTNYHLTFNTDSDIMYSHKESEEQGIEQKRKVCKFVDAVDSGRAESAFSKAHE